MSDVRAPSADLRRMRLVDELQVALLRYERSRRLSPECADDVRRAVDEAEKALDAYDLMVRPSRP